MKEENIRYPENTCLGIMKDIEKVITLLKYDTTELYSILTKEVQTCSIVLEYLSSIEGAGTERTGQERGFFSATKEISDILLKYSESQLKNSYEKATDFDFAANKKDNKNLNSQYWHFFFKRATFFTDLQNLIAALGIIQKSLSQRIGSLPPLIPPIPPISRQKESYLATKMIDDLAEVYSRNIRDSIGKLLKCSESLNANSFKILPIWDHLLDDKVARIIYADDSEETIAMLIRTSYWMPLLPRYFPIVAHEVAHVYFKKYRREIYSILNMNEGLTSVGDLLYDREGSRRGFLEDFIQELFADLFAFSVSGYAYFFALFLTATKSETAFRSENKWEITTFSMLRLRLLLEFITLLQPGKDIPESFRKVFTTFKEVFKSYVAFLNEPELGFMYDYSWGFVHEYKSRLALEDFLFKFILKYFKEDVFRPEYKGIFEFTRIYKQESIEQFVEMLREKAKPNEAGKESSFMIDWTDLMEIGISDVRDVPNLLWYYILNDLGKDDVEDDREKERSETEVLKSERGQRRWPTGRINQEIYRVLREKDTNILANPYQTSIRFGEISEDKKHYEIGNVIEFLYLNIYQNIGATPDNSNRTFIDSSGLQAALDTLVDSSKEKRIKIARYSYNCIGLFDNLIISSPYTVKMNESWPPILSIDNSMRIHYYPISEFYQEVLLKPNNFRSIDEFLELKKTKDDHFLSYHIRFRGATKLSGRIDTIEGILNSLVREGRKTSEDNDMSYFLLKSFGWEDVILLLRLPNNPGLKLMGQLKQKFSKYIESSITHFFFKPESECSIEGIRIISSLKIGRIANLVENIVQDENQYVSSGIYDLFIDWETNKFRRICDLFEEVKKLYNNNYEILDIYSRVLFK